MLPLPQVRYQEAAAPPQGSSLLRWGRSEHAGVLQVWSSGRGNVCIHLVLCCSPRIDPGISYDYEYDYDIVDRAPGYDVYKQSHRGGGRMSSQNNVFSCTQTFQFKAHMKGHPPPPRWRRPGRSGTARRRWRRSSRRCTGTVAASPTARSAGAVQYQVQYQVQC